MPAIRHLAYGEIPIHQHQLYTWKQSGYQGLSSFSITGTNTSFAHDDIVSLIAHHHAVLQHLELKSHLDTTHNSYTCDTMETQQHMQFKQMTALVVGIPFDHGSMDPYLNLIACIIEHTLIFCLLHWSDMD